MASTILSKALYGGPFGTGGRYALATVPRVRRGFHAVDYLVIEPQAGAVLSIADEKVAALVAARKVLRAAKALAYQAELDAAAAAGQLPLFADAPRPTPAEVPRRQPSRRRRDVFERSDGRCHYCSAVLRLDGQWHVEHMLPQALGGEGGPGNLVASCVSCNLSKGDRTAIEFVAQRGVEVEEFA